jgi:hypothetical protein
MAETSVLQNNNPSEPAGVESLTLTDLKKNDVLKQA